MTRRLDQDDERQIPFEQRTKACPKSECKGLARFANFCGAWVCDECEEHLGLARCYCGWTDHGGNGRAELESMGETIEPEL